MSRIPALLCAALGLLVVPLKAFAADDLAPADMNRRALTFAGFASAHFSETLAGFYEGTDEWGSVRQLSGWGISGYAKTGPNTARFGYFRHPRTFTYHLTFTSATGGTYTVDQTMWDPQSGSGVFTLVPLALLPVTNTSTRLTLAPGGSAITGLVVKDHGIVALRIRAAGPALARFGLPHVLSHARLRVYRDGVFIAENAAWSDQPPTVTTGPLPSDSDLGAFPFDPGSNDAEVTLEMPPPGNYTAVVDNPEGTGGDVLLEVYLYR